MEENVLTVFRNPEKESINEQWYEGRNLADLPSPVRVTCFGHMNKGKTNLLLNLFLRAQKYGKTPYKRLYILSAGEEAPDYEGLEPDAVLTSIPPKDFFDGEKCCLIIDDFNFDSLDSRGLSDLFKLYHHTSSHRNVSIFVGFQKFFKIPPFVRELSDVFIFWALTSSIETSGVADRIGVHHKFLKDTFKGLGFYDHIMVDNTKNSPARIRKNIYTQINYDPSLYQHK